MQEDRTCHLVLASLIMLVVSWVISTWVDHKVTLLVTEFNGKETDRKPWDRNALSRQPSAGMENESGT